MASMPEQLWPIILNRSMPLLPVSAMRWSLFSAAQNRVLRFSNTFGHVSETGKHIGKLTIGSISNLQGNYQLAEELLVNALRVGSGSLLVIQVFQSYEAVSGNRFGSG
jgi:hypothetical protein